jgi:hypothetical protein
MREAPHLPRVAIAAGLPVRYLYFTGQSGRRYLFTCVGTDALRDFDAGVAIAASGDAIVWAGEVAELARMPAAALPRRAAIYVHFLAATLSERRAIVADLRAEEPVQLRLAA